MTKQKGITLIGLLFGFLVMMIYFFMLPAIQGVINTVVPQVDQSTGFVISLFPILLFVVILVGILVTGQQQNEYVG